jgi:hypothetical protein
MSLCLTADEIFELTGGLILPRCQVKRLHERGFTRARLERGKAVLERAHYEAVCRGEFAAGPEKRDTPRPRLRAIK